MAWLSGWSRRVEISVSDTNIDSNLTHYPLLITLGSSVGIDNDDVAFIFNEIGNNSLKIAVTKDDGTTQCYVEIEKWESETATAVLWVSRSDLVLSSSATTTLYLYYDVSQSDNTTYIGNTKGTTPVSNVWDSGFVGIWHLDETTGGYNYDSAINSIDATNQGTYQSAPGKIDGGNFFDRDSSEYLSLGNNSAFDMTNTLTLSAWVNADSFPILGGSEPPHYIVAKCADGTNEPWAFRLVGDGINTILRGGSWSSAGGGNYASWTITGWNTGEWHHTCCLYNGTAWEVYFDGLVKADNTDNGPHVNTSEVRIGSAGVTVTSDPLRWWDGYLDEVRVSDTNRSPSWVKVDYYSGSDNLLTWGDTSYSVLINNMGDEVFFVGEQNIDIEGSNFGATQNNGRAELGDNTSYSLANLQSLTVNTWDNTNVNVNIDSLGAVPAGNLWAFITNDTSETSNPYSIYMYALPPWGETGTGTNESTFLGARAMGGTSPDLDGMLLRSINIYVSTEHNSQLRLAVYSGGNLATGPDGASLLHDYGETTGSDTSSWLTIKNLGDDVILPKSSPTWCALKGNDGSFSIGYTTTFPTGSDFQSALGRYSSVVVDGGEAVAYPSTWPADTGGFADYWFSIYLQYIIKTQGYGMRFRSDNSEYLGSATTFDPPANCTVSFWVYNMDSQDGRVLGHSDEWEIYFNGTDIHNDMNWGSSLISTRALNIGNLYHVVMTRASDYSRQIFIDGELDNSDSGGDATTAAATLYVSSRQTPSYHLDGYLEDIRIYDRVLSAGEVETIYACKGIDNITYGLLHRYMLNELPMDLTASGVGSIKDLGLNQNNMTPTNGPEYTGSRIRTKRLC